jgi:hypothetical protein
MLATRIRRLAPGLLVLLAPSAALGDEPIPWEMPYHHRPPVVLPEEGPPPWGARGVVYLHVETQAPRLEMRVFDGHYRRRRGWGVLSRRICVAPCDQIVDAREGARYFFQGPGLTSSDLFRLNDRAGPLTARVVAGSRRAGEAGALAGVFGLASTFAGGLVLGVGQADPFDKRGMTMAGGVLLANGAVLGAVAAILISKAITTVRWSLPAPP